MTQSHPASDKIQELKTRMARVGIREADLEEDFVRGSGAGGQKINKTSSTVCLRHRPTGLEVRCQATRSQAQNRFLARRLLVEKLEAVLFRERSEREQAREKIRRQKRKRSKRAKEKMLAGKKHHSEKKALRRKVDS